MEEKKQTEMEVTPRNKLLTLLTLSTLFVNSVDTVYSVDSVDTVYTVDTVTVAYTVDMVYKRQTRGLGGLGG